MGGGPGRRTKQTARRTSDCRSLDTRAVIEEPDCEDEPENLTYSLDLDDVLLLDVSEGGATISKSPVAVNYTVDELTTIPSDNESHKVLVAIIPLEASISHITTPRKSPLAYLQVQVMPLPLFNTGLTAL